ncbi:ADP-ribose glycohydrolase MACROD1 isoform X2 [Coregonus clupeaformis]|uniref:ADP-ribose glycohydrolase MACROD1 isoform X2 n=1 Tax=Coregonus clupeaformis TaxID=59861 RepID=UPI001BDFA0D6|nr:ADP-ribose glycohydrolase MACROD1 isoform X2 [Coregonus clupeaformis]
MAFQMSTLSSRIRAIGPLSRCRSGDFHTSDIVVCSKFRNIFGVANRQVYSLVRSGQSSANSSPAKCKAILKPGGIHIANRVEKFSTTTSAAKSFESFQGHNKASTSGGKYGSLYRIALAALGVTTAVVSLHASAHLAMAEGSERLNLDSAKGDWNEVKDALLHMSQEERRKHYRTTYLSLDEVPVWTAKSLVDTGGVHLCLQGDSVKGTNFKRNEALDKKISLFSGDITKLEIDGIVNAANKTLLGGGGVDGAIHRTAGPLLRSECAELRGCETGEAKITGGYGLPAKYVIHTVGPIAMGEVGEEERSRLRDCYHHSLEKATDTKLRTVAFPCISTGIYGYPPEQAVHVALDTVRKYLDEHHEKLDRVIFCVFLPTDKELYLKNLPLYFPPAC